MIYSKNNKTAFLLVILLLAGSFQTMAQSENKLIRKGNNAYQNGDYQTAEIDYRKALEKNKESVKGDFNLGGAMYQQKSFEEAAKKFETLTGENIPPDQKAGAYHNLGNSLMSLQQYQPAIEAYKNALRQNPDDSDTKYNLEYARRMLQQQQQQQNQEQNKDNKDQQKQEQKQDKQDKQEQQDQKDQQQENKDQQNQEQQQNNQNQQQQAQPKQISKEDAERMLQALKDNEKETMEKIKLEKLKSAKKVKSEKDW